jgi:hypothetical protein
MQQQHPNSIPPHMQQQQQQQQQHPIHSQMRPPFPGQNPMIPQHHQQHQQQQQQQQHSGGLTIEERVNIFRV